MVSVACLFTNMAFGAGIGAFGSYWSTEDADSGYGYGVRLASTSDPAGYLEVRASRFDDLSDDDSSMDMKLTVTPIDVGITLRGGPEDAIEFYIGGGGSYYIIDSEIETAGGTKDIDIDDEWGWYGLVGFELDLSENLTLFAEGIYRNIEGSVPGDEIGNANSDTDFELTGFGGNAGIMLMF